MTKPLEAAAQALGRDPRDLVLAGGDDFELLVAGDPGTLDPLVEAFQERFGISLTKIGHLTTDLRICIRTAPDASPILLPDTGYEHFGAPT